MKAAVRTALIRVACLLAASSSSAGLACTINVVYSDTANPPYQMGDGEAVPLKPGIAVELVNDAAHRIGCRIQWRRVPNKRVQLEMQDGRADAMLMFSHSDDRAAYAVYPMKDGKPDPNLRLGSLSYYVYVAAGSPVSWVGKQFGGLNQPVGVNAGYSVAQDLAKIGVPIEENSSTENNLKKLKLGRIGAYVMQDFPADVMIETRDITGIQKLPVPFSSKDYYLPFSKKFYAASPGVAQKLWKNIAELRKSQGRDLMKQYKELARIATQ